MKRIKMGDYYKYDIVIILNNINVVNLMYVIIYIHVINNQILYLS